jgi:hypothetical protein
MEGVGRIYRLYRDGVLTSDDEVALVFDPETGIALSEPLINIRCTLAKAEEEGVIGHEAGSILLATAQSLYFPDRTWETILASAGPGIKETSSTVSVTLSGTMPSTRSSTMQKRPSCGPGTWHGSWVSPDADRGRGTSGRNDLRGRIHDRAGC